MPISQTGHQDFDNTWVGDPQDHDVATVAPAIIAATATLAAFPIENAAELLATEQVSAFLRTVLAGTNNNVDVVAVAPGSGGLAITLAIVVAGNNTALSVGVVGNAITVNSATDGSGNPTTTAAKAIAAIRLSAAASALVTVALAPSNDGTGVLAALAATNLGDVSGTTPTIDAKLQTTIDSTGAAGWYDVPNGAFGQKTAVGSEGKVIVGLGLFGRWVLTIGGTTPKAAVGIKAQFRRH